MENCNLENKSFQKCVCYFCWASYRQPNLRAKKKVAMINRRIYLDSDKKEYLWYPIPVHKTTYFIADNRDDLKLAELISAWPRKQKI